MTNNSQPEYKPVKKNIYLNGEIKITNENVEHNIDEDCDQAAVDLFAFLRVLKILQGTEGIIKDDEEDAKEQLQEVKGILIQHANAYTKAMVDQTSKLN